MTVLDNVKVGGHARGRNGAIIDALTLPSARREERDFDDSARAVLAFVGMEREASRPAALLSFAARKRVELARALAARPSLLLLDEPAGGLNHDEVAELGGVYAVVVRHLHGGRRSRRRRVRDVLVHVRAGRATEVGAVQLARHQHGHAHEHADQHARGADEHPDTHSDPRDERQPGHRQGHHGFVLHPDLRGGQRQ